MGIRFSAPFDHQLKLQATPCEDCGRTRAEGEVNHMDYECVGCYDFGGMSRSLPEVRALSQAAYEDMGMRSTESDCFVTLVTDEVLAWQGKRLAIMHAIMTDGRGYTRHESAAWHYASMITLAKLHKEYGEEEMVAG